MVTSVAKTLQPETLIRHYKDNSKLLREYLRLVAGIEQDAPPLDDSEPQPCP